MLDLDAQSWLSFYARHRNMFTYSYYSYLLMTYCNGTASERIGQSTESYNDRKRLVEYVVLPIELHSK